MSELLWGVADSGPPAMMTCPENVKFVSANYTQRIRIEIMIESHIGAYPARLKQSGRAWLGLGGNARAER